MTFFGYSLPAQDLPYSLHHFTPLTLNPALVSAGNSPEAGFFYRYQRMGPEKGYPATQLSLIQPLRSSGAKWGGVGLQMADSRSGEASFFRRQHLTAALAYLLNLSPRQSLSIGFSGGFEKSSHSPDVPTVENFRARSLTRTTFKLNSGLFYRAVGLDGRENIYLGLSLVQASRPEENFTFFNKVPSTFLLSGGFNLWRNETIAIMPQILWNNRAGYNFVNLGGKMNYSLRRINSRLISGEGSFDVGLGYINEQALVLALTLYQPFYHLGFSYDFSLRPLAESAIYRAGPEVAFRFFPEMVLLSLKTQGNRSKEKGRQEKEKVQNVAVLQPQSPLPMPIKSLEEKPVMERSIFPDPVVETAPAPTAVKPLIENNPFQNRKLSFDFNKNLVESQEEKEFLNQVVDFLLEHPGLTLRIVGHTDNIGQDDDNIKLSFRRAQLIADFLMTGGIQGERLVVEGHGSFNPLVPNSSAENRARNRRVEIFFE
jgi:type IX secretion system PorP/SprF family membrane protein